MLTDHRYVGDYKNGKRTGFGTLTMANGNRYEGEFKHDKKTGFGVYTWQNGNRYEGRIPVIENQQLILPHFTTGIFKNDKRTGKGVFFRANGEKYEGEFRDGKRHGVGLSHISDDKTGQEKVP